MKLRRSRWSRVQILLDAPQISSDGGLVLLKKTEERAGLLRRIGSLLKDSRRRRSVKHTKDKMLSQRVMAICQGWEDCNDFNELRKDPLYSLALAGEPASQPTLSTFENSVGRKEIHRISQEMLHFFIDRHRSRRPKRIVIDMDATEDPAHGQQELEFYHGFYGGHCFLPLLVFATADDGPMELVAAVLRPGNSHAGRRSVAVLKRIVAPLKEAFPDAEILVRADAGFALPAVYSLCEEEQIGYAISLPKNGRLGEASSSLMQEAQELRDMTGQKARLFDSFDYAAGTWPCERRVILKAEAMTKGLNPRYVLTNLQGDPEEIYSFYCQRGDSENRIKEMKLDLFSGRTSCHRFTANAFRLLLHALAFILMTLVREMLSGTELARCTMGTIRLKLLKMAAILEDTTRRTLVRLPRGHPHAHLLQELCS